MTFLCVCVCSLNHVELVHYAISDSLADTLSQASGLQQLCVWPDPGQQVSDFSCVA